jgi:hypothetical protein
MRFLHIAQVLNGIGIAQPATAAPRTEARA